MKAGIFKAPLTFVSAESDPAWLWVLDKAWLLLSYSGHFLGCRNTTSPVERAGSPDTSLGGRVGGPGTSKGTVWVSPGLLSNLHCRPENMDGAGVPNHYSER